jgi:hypothetical protein
MTCPLRLRAKGSHRNNWMSLELEVYVEPDELPQPGVWAASIKAHGFDVDLCSDFDLFTHSGYLPCPDHDMGFEYCFESVTEHDRLLSEEETKPSLLKDHVCIFRTGSRTSDLVAATVSAAVLAYLSGGTLKDCESGICYSGTEALDWARRVCVDVERPVKYKTPTKHEYVQRYIPGAFLIYMLVGWFIKPKNKK